MAATAFELFKTIETESRRCAQHGDYQSDRYIFGGMDRWTPCPGCSDEKRRADDLASQRAFAAEQRQRQIELALKNAAIPGRFEDASFENYECRSEQQRKVFEGVRDYAAHLPEIRRRGTSAIMTGGVGTGKTHLAIATARAAILEHRMTARYTSVDRVFSAIKSTFDTKGGQTEQSVYSGLRTPDLLILDEVGVQAGSDFERRVLFEVINSRYEDQRPTMVISNLPVRDIEQCIGQRSFDRLRDDGGKTFVFAWASNRRGAL